MRNRRQTIRRDLQGAWSRVFRGGGWFNAGGCCRSAHRSYNIARVACQLDVGFRVALVLADKAAQPCAVGHASAAVPVEPIVPAKPVPLDLKPDAKAWDLKPGSPLNPASLVLKPAAIKGLRSWTLETCALSRWWLGPVNSARMISCMPRAAMTASSASSIRPPENSALRW